MVTALRETTGGAFPAHTYLLDGTDLVAYIRVGHTEPYYFKQPIKGFSKSGRKFSTVEPSPFTVSVSAEPDPALVRVQGSKPNTWYWVNTELKTCTCSGYTFRGACRHVTALS